jgi:uncharacterized protein (TIGR02588 family)
MNQQGETTGDQTVGQQTDGEARRPPRSIAEWTTLLGSLVIIAILAGAALYEQFARDEPAGTWLAVDVDAAAAVKRGDQHYVPFVVTNRGSKPAEDVAVIFEISNGESVVEESTVQIPFLPNSGSVEGELVTTLDPATHAIEGRPAALLTP